MADIETIDSRNREVNSLYSHGLLYLVFHAVTETIDYKGKTELSYIPPEAMLVHAGRGQRSRNVSYVTVNQTDTNQENAVQLLCENYNMKDFMQIMACIIQNGFDIKKHNSSVLRCALDSSMDRSQQDEVLRLLTRYGLNNYSPSTSLRKLRNKDGNIRIGFIDYLVENRKTLGWHEG
ncbi:hypothetical protein DAPPUDRAFT_102755 [Daphnia pulex]|uniref:Uncharacterized protein n=1 Tax=Daphnia pulex TaxID=6669 RepID=E9GHF0_DAPPU|nr:hypothetical protein DAPPUDRAFT_102755 [Daphnia pulex]|eukprot:EFX81182.1 hypothetical protein DAPPUDRAFT_102755 [Daphnia pulex]